MGEPSIQSGPGQSHHDPLDVTRFVAGMSRAGTQWMCKCLNEHPDAAAFGESMFFGRRFVAPGNDGLYRAAHFAELRRRLLEHGTCIHSTAGGGPGGLKRLTLTGIGPLVHQLFPDDGAPCTPGDAFRRLAGAVASAEGKPIAIEKTPHHLNWIDRIVQFLPHARFVVMVREPYSFMLSYKHQGDRKSDRVRRAFEKRYHPAACALVWKGSMLAAGDAVCCHPDRTLLVRFDDLRADPRGVLDRVQRFLDLRPVDVAAAVPPDNTSFPAGARPELRAEDVFWMNRIAGRVMTQRGFQIRRPEGGRLRVVWSYLRFPWWAARNYFNLRSRVSGSTSGYLLRWLRPTIATEAATEVDT